MPAKSIAALTEAIDGIRGGDSQLQQDSAALRCPIRSFTTFHQFSKLPAEQRQAIWGKVLGVPQIHVVERNRISQSRINIAMQACKEAKAEGLNLKLPGYKLRTWELDMNPRVQEHPLRYTNSEVDTLWIKDYEAFSEDTELAWVCGNCRQRHYHGPWRHCLGDWWNALRDGPTSWLCPQCKSSKPSGFRAMAISESAWQKPPYSQGLLNALHCYGLEWDRAGT